LEIDWAVASVPGASEAGSETERGAAGVQVQSSKLAFPIILSGNDSVRSSSPSRGRLLSPSVKSVKIRIH
jgi:hypothetical protein